MEGAGFGSCDEVVGVSKVTMGSNYGKTGVSSS